MTLAETTSPLLAVQSAIHLPPTLGVLPLAAGDVKVVRRVSPCPAAADFFVPVNTTRIRGIVFGS